MGLMNEIVDNVQLLAVKSVVDITAKATKELLVRQLAEMGIEAEVEVIADVKSVNLETLRAKNRTIKGVK